jgi:hypothetical protein
MVFHHYLYTGKFIPSDYRDKTTSRHEKYKKKFNVSCEGPVLYNKYKSPHVTKLYQ